MRPEDFTSEVWLRLTAELGRELAELRAKNDSKSLDTTETAYIRGRIYEVKRILSLSRESDRQGDDPSTFG